MSVCWSFRNQVDSTGGFLLLRYFSGVAGHFRDLQLSQYIIGLIRNLFVYCVDSLNG